MTKSKRIKCVIVGDGAVGKTCMFMAYCLDKFPEDYVPTVFDNYQVEVQVNNTTQVLELWDTAGQEEYEQLRPLSYPDTDVFIICYSIVDRSSFENVDKWYNELMSYWKDKTHSILVVLVGNKTDLITNPVMLRKLAEKKEKVVTLKESEIVAERIGAFATVQCSAKSRDNLKKVFDTVVNCALEYRYSNEKSCSVA